MSHWLQRLHQPKTQLTSQSQDESIPSDPFSSGRTVYISTNTKERRSFYANAPAGSKHAARLQKLALQQQPEYRTPGPNAANMLERKVQRSVTAQGEPPTDEDDEDDDDDDDLNIISPAGLAQARRQVSVAPATTSTNPRTQRSPYGQTRPEPTIVDRYERGGTIAYHKKAAGGELLISAPVGSQEAKSMDDAAARLLAAQAAYPVGSVSGKRLGIGR